MVRIVNLEKVIKKSLIFTLSLIALFSSCKSNNSNNNLQLELVKQLQRLEDKEEIEKVVKAYALSMDTRDWDLHSSIFTKEYKLYRKGKYKNEQIEDRVKRLDRFTKQYEWTRHLASIYSIDLKADSAFVISSLLATHKGKQLEKGRQSKDYTMVGHYHYWLIRTQEGWKINKMRLIRFRNK